MKNRLLSLIIMGLCLPLFAAAQAHFGFLSYSRTLQAMPQYAIVQQQVAALHAQYDQELKRAEDEFNKKYEEFIEQQGILATPIRMKRQAELQELMEKNLAFRDEARRLLSDAEAQLTAPLYEQLDKAIQTVGQQRGYAFILNTDGHALPYINPEQGEDVSAAVAEALNSQP